MEQYEETTPIERPLLRSDLNDIRDIVHSISERQLQFLNTAQATERRVTRLEQHIWLPALVSIVAAALAVLARVAP
jgi:hypothetical protein